jgi:hypothetical protein
LSVSPFRVVCDPLFPDLTDVLPDVLPDDFSDDFPFVPDPHGPLDLHGVSLEDLHKDCRQYLYDGLPECLQSSLTPEKNFSSEKNFSPEKNCDLLSSTKRLRSEVDNGFQHFWQSPTKRTISFQDDDIFL